MARYTVSCRDGSVRHVQAHSVSHVGDRLLFHVRDEREPVCSMPREEVAEVRRQVVEINGMTRMVRARVVGGRQVGHR